MADPIGHGFLVLTRGRSVAFAAVKPREQSSLCAPLNSRRHFRHHGFFVTQPFGSLGHCRLPRDVDAPHPPVT